MPSPRSLTPSPAQHSILLLEDYDALAAAIGSALKKFAPGKSVGVARSVAEAEKLSGKHPIELFIIDFDPSYPGLAGSLQKMRKAHPDARVLILAGNIPARIVAERRPSAAIQFVEKPYEVPDFGAAVQALLGPWSGTDPAHARGTLNAFGVADAVALLCAGGRSAIVDVKGAAGDTGVVHILKGQIVHAETDEHEGRNALAEMFAWTSPRIRETEKRIPATRNLQGPWTDLFLEAWRQARPPMETAPEEPAPRPKTGKKIVVIDDTEMLLIFVEDALTTADPELQITTALSGTDGVSRVTEVQPDLVLLDYSLPDINGDEVCRRLLENEATSQIPILMMSGHVAQMAATAAQYHNVVATIEKPFLSEALVALVQRTLTAGTKPKIRPAPAPVPAPVAAPPPPIAPPAPVEIVEAKPVALPAKPVPRQPLLQPHPQPAIVEHTPEVPKVTVSQPHPEMVRPVRGLPRTAPTIPSVEKNEVVLGLFLEVMSMQLTPQLRMGAIRARPASGPVSLHFLSPQSAMPNEIGFQLGAAELNEKREISTLRLIPSTKPFEPAQTRNAFEIGGVALVPSETRARVQLTPAGTTPMTMELLAKLEMGGVELSSTFQVAQLVLKWQSSAVRITLNPKAPERNGASFQASSVVLDKSGRIAELLLSPIK